MKVLRGTPVVFHIQDLQFDAAIELNMLGSRRLAGVLALVERAALNSATHISTISQSMREKIVSKGISPSRVTVVANWASVQPEINESKISRLRSALGVFPDQILVVYAGNLGRKQGLMTLLESADRLRDEYAIKFLIVGRGAEEQRLKEHAADTGLTNVHFSNPVPEDKLPALLTAADLHVVMQEGAVADLVMPSKLTNIMAVGRPSLVTAHYRSELGRVLVDNDAGVLVPPGNPSALAAAIMELACDPARRTALGQNARAFADENLAINSIMPRLEATLQQLTQSQLNVSSGLGNKREK